MILPRQRRDMWYLQKRMSSFSYRNYEGQCEDAITINCFYCKGQTIETTAKFIVDLRQCVVIVKNIPARVCQQCGETSYSSEVAHQKIVEAVKHSIMSEVAIIEYSRNVA